MIVDLVQQMVSAHRVSYDLSGPLAATRSGWSCASAVVHPVPIRVSVASGLRALRLDRPVRQFAGLLGLDRVRGGLSLNAVEVFRHPRNDAAKRGEIARRNAFLGRVGNVAGHAEQFVAQTLRLGG